MAGTTTKPILTGVVLVSSNVPLPPYNVPYVGNLLDMTLTRRLDHAYDDGVYHPSGSERPNPLDISEYVMKGKTGNPSYMNRTALMTFFGKCIL